MSTRAIYTFVDKNNEGLHVYKHHDGYPSGACKAIKNALNHSWALPRFEADDFGAAFVAGNKPSAATIVQEARNRFTIDEARKYYVGGGVRLLESGDWKKVAPGDIQYRYLIQCVGGELQITAFGVNCGSNDKLTVDQIFEGTLAEFEKFAEDN